jgi:hypothetical protein
MHERSPKSSAINTLLYERDMLRYCAETIDTKQKRFQQSKSDEDAAEYYLGIEGFLLHFRNLLGFFINKGPKSTDLTIDHPERWADGKPVDESVCRKLTKSAKKVNQDHGLDGGDCYQKISWFLQHCTVYRHRQPRNWDIDRMFADIRPVLDEFVTNFAPEITKNEVVIVGRKSHGTATITRTAAFPP